MENAYDIYAKSYCLAWYLFDFTQLYAVTIFCTGSHKNPGSAWMYVRLTSVLQALETKVNNQVDQAREPISLLTTVTKKCV